LPEIHGTACAEWEHHSACRAYGQGIRGASYWRAYFLGRVEVRRTNQRSESIGICRQPCQPACWVFQFVIGGLLAFLADILIGSGNPHHPVVFNNPAGKTLPVPQAGIELAKNPRSLLATRGGT
jgi:hypothetical protein